MMNDTWRKLGAALLTCCALWACEKGSSSDGGAAPTPDTSDTAQRRREVLQGVSARVIVPALEGAADKLDALKVAAARLEGSGSAEDLAATQAAWREAMDLWQEVEVMQVGPAGVATDTAGGEGLRDEVYGWPLLNRCRIDQVLVEGKLSAEELAAQPINVRGLGAIEYLLYATPDNACLPNLAINAQGQWAALGQDEVARRRRQMLSALSSLAADKAKLLRDAWSPQAGNFAQTLGAAGDGSTLYPSAQDGLNALSDAMFYLELFTKDMKVGRPSGAIGCSTATCPEALESPFSKRSAANVAANLRGFQKLFLGAAPGTDAPGFDDLLREAGAPELADQMGADLDAAILAAESLPGGSMEEALASDPASVAALFQALQKLSDELKTQFLTVLDLELPKRAEADND
jgi:predicted lipoprotein